MRNVNVLSFVGVLTIFAVVNACATKGPYCFTDGSSCTCDGDEAGNSTSCSVSSIGTGAICCADTGWATSGSCTCANIGCYSSFSECECGYAISDYGSVTDSCAPTTSHPYCCLAAHTCSCSDEPCSDPSAAVDACTTDIVQNPCGDQIQLTSCSEPGQ